MSVEQSIPLSEYLAFMTLLSAPTLLLALLIQSGLFAVYRAYTWRSVHRILIGYGLTLLLTLPLNIALMVMMGRELNPGCCKRWLNSIMTPISVGHLPWVPASLLVIAVVIPLTTWCVLRSRKPANKPTDFG